MNLLIMQLSSLHPFSVQIFPSGPCSQTHFWTFITAYSKGKFKSSGDKASPCFGPFWTGELSEKCLPIWILLYILLKHILFSITNFMGSQNSMRILHNNSSYTISLLQTYLKPRHDPALYPLPHLGARDSTSPYETDLICIYSLLVSHQVLTQPDNCQYHSLFQ
jgi:hypothetical protein